MEFFLSAFLGFIAVTILDIAWFRIDYKKAERGLEVLEHYHYSIGLIGLGVFVHFPVLSYFLFGAGAGFVYHEAKQNNLFAYKSDHFASSTAIGIILAAVASLAYFL